MYFHFPVEFINNLTPVEVKNKWKLISLDHRIYINKIEIYCSKISLPT